jgi:transcriptional regulator with PAS, ATPase and Fis domain
MEMVLRVAPQDTTILLTGETGTGKSRLANLIHQLSPRREQPFLVVNCAALAANLVESELFGHVKGAFTGADRDRLGKCAEVGQGTLLLDDVDSLSPETQAKLLRLVEDRLFERVGANRVLPMEARLIVTTNRNLREAVANGRFRADLFYRLNVVEFAMIPLRVRLQDRPDELARLVETFLAASNAKLGRTIKGFTPEALHVMQTYSWPGNIREVRNAIERAVAFSSGPLIRVDDLPNDLRLDPPHSFNPWHAAPTRPVAVAADGTLAHSKVEAEIARINLALTKHAGNRQRAASELGISRMTLYNKLRRYGI